MSPLASAKVLPCSEDNSRARSSYSSWISSRNLNMTRARRCGLVAAQRGKAAWALAIAFSTSALLASATLACTSPVLGLKTSPKRPDAPFTSLPPMKWPISRMRFSPWKLNGAAAAWVYEAYCAVFSGCRHEAAAGDLWAVLFEHGYCWATTGWPWNDVDQKVLAQAYALSFADERSNRLDRQQHNALAQRRADETMAFVKGDSRVVDRVCNHTADTRDLGCG